MCITCDEWDLEQRNKNPKPLAWTANADMVLGKDERLCPAQDTSLVRLRRLSCDTPELSKTPWSHLRAQRACPGCPLGTSQFCDSLTAGTIINSWNFTPYSYSRFIRVRPNTCHESHGI